jgi:hypothetical protein
LEGAAGLGVEVPRRWYNKSNMERNMRRAVKEKSMKEKQLRRKKGEIEKNIKMKIEKVMKGNIMGINKKMRK